MSQYKVTVFSTTYCASCQALKQWLDKHKVEYQAVNLEESPERQAEILAKSGSFQVPITLIQKPDGSEEVITGPQYADIKKALQLT